MVLQKQMILLDDLSRKLDDHFFSTFFGFQSNCVSPTNINSLYHTHFLQGKVGKDPADAAVLSWIVKP